MANISRRGVEHDEAFLESLRNDLVGARLVILVTLTASSPGDVVGVARKELELRKQEADDLLREVLFLHPSS